MQRREFLQSAGMAAVVSRLPMAVHSGEPPSTLRPKRLTAGDSVMLVAPANATFESLDLQIAKESLEALGFNVRVGAHLLDRHGYLAGDDRSRAEDINRAFADRTIG